MSAARAGSGGRGRRAGPGGGELRRAAAAGGAAPPARPQSAPGARAARRHGDGALHRDGAQVRVPVEHHRHRVPRPGAEGRGLGRGHEGDRPGLR